MIELKGKYNTAKIFTDNVEDSAKEQIIQLLNQDFIKNGKVRVMADVHAGAGCVIGFTADLGDKVIPNLVGVDIGCGMILVKLGQIDMNLENLDSIIHKYIPSGYNVHEGRIVKFPKLQELYCYRNLKDTKRIERSIGTLGGGKQ
jgi:tRNA-splicing ligase RtcB